MKLTNKQTAETQLPEEKVNKLDVSLFVDVPCCECAKQMAMSNAIQCNNKYYCTRCHPEKEIIGMVN